MSVALAEQIIEVLLFEVSTDPVWRARLFAAKDLVRFAVPDDELCRYAPDARGCGLHFVVFVDGVTDDGAFVFGFECAEHPGLTRYSTNNPSVA